MVSIVIPVHNEEEAIGDDLDVIRDTMKHSAYDYEIIVVDDGSTDKSAEIVRSKSDVALIQHSYNKGVGAARKTGLLHARGHIVVMTDGDGTYPNQDIPALLGFFQTYDMVVGARVVESGTWRSLRAPAKWAIRQLACFITGAAIPDLNSGFRAFRRDIALKFFNILPDTHSWVSTLTIAFLANGYDVKYIPIAYHKRKGKSTFHPLKDTLNYVTLVVRTIMYFDPLRFFLPLAILIFTLGSIRLIYDAIYLSDVKESDIMLVLTGIMIGVMGLLADLIVKQHKGQYLDLQGRGKDGRGNKNDSRSR